MAEGKGRVTSKDDAKEAAAKRWVAAVNTDRRWDTWAAAVVKHRGEVCPTIDAAVADVAATGSR